MSCNCKLCENEVGYCCGQYNCKCWEEEFDQDEMSAEVEAENGYGEEQ